MQRIINYCKTKIIHKVLCFNCLVVQKSQSSSYKQQAFNKIFKKIKTDKPVLVYVAWVFACVSSSSAAKLEPV